MSHLKAALPIVILLNLALSAQIAKADYQNEAGLYTYQSKDTDDHNFDGSTLYYTYYFNNVSTAKGPWAEAAFINRSGGVGVGIDRSGYDSKSTTGDTSGYFIGADISNAESNFIFSAAYQADKTDYKSTTSSFAYSTETSDKSLGIGYFVQQYTLVSFSHDESDTEYTGLSNTFNYDLKTNTITVKSIFLRDDTTAVSLIAGYSDHKFSDGGKYNSTYVTGNYYLNPRLGVGAGVTLSSGNFDAAKGKSYTVNINYYINPNIQLGLLYGQFKADNNKGTDSDITQLMASGYF